MSHRHVMALGFVVLLAGVAGATGVMIPTSHDVPPLAIKYQRVSVQIDNQVARTAVAQSFVNSTSRQLEATYVFPLPKGASVSDFTMTIDGKEVKGELLEAAQARKIYQDIVRRMKDPGLLEYLGNDVFKASVFPIPPRGEQKIQVQYSQICSRDAGICQYTYPLKIDDKASSTLEDFSVAVTVKSREAIKTLYSPTHKISVTKKDDHTAIVGFEENRVLLDKDFVLYYTLSEKDFGLDLLTHRAKGEDGYYMVLISPRTEFKQEDILAKDICFVIDSSGSMRGQKLEQAKEALKYCVTNLHDKDRFNIIRFSTAVDAFEDDLQPATKDNVERATAFIEKIETRGGTNIDGALRLALATKIDPARPYLVVFLTDGLPTQGDTTDPVQIVAHCKQKLSPNTRLFCFGVGNDVNAHLLDNLGEMSRGLSSYVKPDEDIEVKVSSFHDKVNYPVLADLSLDAGPIKLRDVYPQKLPDLFKGSQLVVLGRYRQDGDAAIRLKGSINGKPAEFVYEGTFPQAADGSEFIARLWATRKVGYLLDQIRLHGEKPELRDEVVALAKTFGIVTPYTSYLIVPDEPAGGHQLADGAFQGRRGGVNGRVPLAPPATKAGPGKPLDAHTAVGAPVDPARPAPDRQLSKDEFKKLREAAEKLPRAGMAGGDRDALRAQTGAAGVRAAEALARLKHAKEAGGRTRRSGVRIVADKVLYLVEGSWTDRDYDEKAQKVKVQFGSDAYLVLVEVAPDNCKQAILLGDRVVLMLPCGKCLVIGEEGLEKLDRNEAQKLFAK